MQKEFYPNVEYNRKRISKLIFFYVLMCVLSGTFAVMMITQGQMTIGLLMLGLIVVMFSMIPSSLAQYPVKYKPLMTIDGKSVVFAPNEKVAVNQIVAVSVCIDVPPVGKTEKENKEFLLKVSSEKPTEPILGACDVTIKNEKGKEVIKYAIIEDCIGALEAFLEMGVKKYRILYSLKKYTEEAKYSMVAGEEERVESIQTLSEKEKLDQLA